MAPFGEPDSQVSFNEPTMTAAADPPVKTPKTNTIFRVYHRPDCDTISFNAEYDLRPGICYSLPIRRSRGNLLFYDCGQGEFSRLHIPIQTPPGLVISLSE